jgi:DNA polymerase III alpha subunit
MAFIHLHEFTAPNGKANAAYLRELCEEGFAKRYGKAGDWHRERLERELGAIAEIGHVEYFLIVWDFIRYAREKGIFVGPGRGSAAGSIVSYVLHITDVDPLEYGLIFERFLNPERGNMPDIDIDLCIERSSEVIRYVEENCGECIDFSKMRYNDPNVFDLISSGNTEGIFQLESVGMMNLIMRLRPGNIDDIAAPIALYHPGPMRFIDDYVENKNRPDRIRYIHPLLESILSDTYGIVVYQEQIMEILHQMAGYSYESSDIVRRAMCKKKDDVMRKARDSFINGVTEDGVKVSPGCVANGIPENVAGKIFDRMSKFAMYASCRSHNMACAVTAYRMAWLKTYYPEIFEVCQSEHPLDDYTTVIKKISSSEDSYVSGKSFIAAGGDTDDSAVKGGDSGLGQGEVYADKELKDGMSVCFVGVISEKHTSLTIMGDMYARARIEDRYGSVDLLIWPEPLKEANGVVENGNVVVVYGSVQIRGRATPTIIVSEVRPIDSTEYRYPW